MFPCEAICSFTSFSWWAASSPYGDQTHSLFWEAELKLFPPEDVSLWGKKNLLKFIFPVNLVFLKHCVKALKLTGLIGNKVPRYLEMEVFPSFKIHGIDGHFCELKKKNKPKQTT